METIESVIKHELCHYHMFKTGANWSDGDYLFKKEIKKIGASLTGELKSAGLFHQSICSKCGKITNKGTEKKIKNRINSNKYTSKCCHVPIAYGGVSYLEDNNKVQPLTSQYAKRIKEIQTNIISKKESSIKDSIEQNYKVAIQPGKENILDINKIIQPGKRGMNGTILYPIVKELIDNKEEEKLRLINKEYNKYFIQIKKCWGKKRLNYLESIGL
jgi:hypothetical protein